MTELLFASAVALLLSPAPVAESQSGSPTTRQSAVEQELIALDKKFDEARRKGDTAFVADLLTEDFVRITGAAAVQSKADIMKAMAADVAGGTPPPPPAPDAPPLTYTVQLHGDTAVMAHAQKGNEVFPDGAAMHVFVKQQGRWKMAGWGSVTGRPNAEQSINDAGYQMMEGGKVKEAIELFKTNVQLFPQSWNVYDSLGEAYAKSGDTALAIQNYEKSIQMNPKNEAGKAALAKLKGK